MSAWPVVTIGDVVTLQRGFDITKAQQIPGPFPVISSSGPTSWHAKYKVEPLGVVIGRKGSLGGVYLAEQPYWPHDTTLWVKDFHGNDPRFVYYWLQTQQLEYYDVGASNPTLNRNHLHGLVATVPPVRIQRKIAAVLSAYDDRIENNNRRIELLEELARRIYREWFIDFRYPGHEDVCLVESELGPIPEDWDVSPVGSMTRVLGGGTPSKGVADYWAPGTITWFTPTDLTRASAIFVSESALMISEQGLARSAAKLFPPGAVMMTSRATIGVVAITTVCAATNQGFIICVPTESIGKYHLFFWLCEKRDLITALASGATFKEINKKTFREIPFVSGPNDVERRFEDVLGPIAQQILNLLRTQRTLRETRDILLPRLMSGDVDVSDLEVGAPEIAP